MEKRQNIIFCLLATQNPNKNAYVGKRQELSPEFLSRFQKIYFPDITLDEMVDITFGIAENVGYLKMEDGKINNIRKRILTEIVIGQKEMNLKMIINVSQ